MSAAAGPAAPDRRAELAVALAGLRERIATAAVVAGRDPAEISLVAVTKTFPASDVALLANLGLTDFGENRDQEAGPKTAEVAGLHPRAAVRWHMVGRLQRNKARSVVRWADMVQSVDSQRLADALDRAVRNAREAGERAGRPERLEVLLQVSLDDDPDRGGCLVPELPALAEHVAGLAGLDLRGVMAVAPLGTDPAAAYARLGGVAERLRSVYPQASVLSAGMTGDLEAAIGHGSTCVRVGTALLGHRGLASP